MKNHLTAYIWRASYIRGNAVTERARLLKQKIEFACMYIDPHIQRSYSVIVSQWIITIQLSLSISSLFKAILVNNFLADLNQNTYK